MKTYKTKFTDSKAFRIITVCSNCFATLDKCNCNHPKKFIIFVDKHIQPILEILNQKGYRTLFSCESHAEINPNKFCIYIMFKEPIPKELQNVEDFTFKRKDTIIEYLIQDAEKKCLIDLIEEKKEHLRILYNWSEKLPHRKQAEK